MHKGEPKDEDELHNLREAESPYPFLLSGLVLTISGFLFFGIAVPAFLPKWSGNTSSLASSLFLALAGVFTGSIVYMRIYDYVNLRNQVRDWRHEYAMKHIEGIYTPLWLETRGIIQAVGQFNASTTWQSYVPPNKDGLFRSKVFADIMNGPQHLFVDWTLYTLLMGFHDQVAKYDQSIKSAKDEVYKNAVEMLGESGTVLRATNSHGLNKLLALVINDSDSQWIYDYLLRSDYVESVLTKFTEAYAEIRPTEEARDCFILVADRLRSLPSVAIAREMRERCMLAGQQCIERLREVFRDPISTVRPFYEKEDEDSQYFTTNAIIHLVDRNTPNPSIRDFLPPGGK